MNREIKFRTWDKLGIRFPTTDAWYQIKDGEIELPKDTVLMQYTGMKDKNGKEIYEGDIVKPVLSGMDGEYGEVLWEDVNCAFMIDWNKAKNLGKYDYQLQSHIEIIGNIYENSELLN